MATPRTDSEESRFSDELESWVEGPRPVTIGGLANAIDERSFAVVLAVLLFPSALPIPTGGVTHVFELVAARVAGQMVVGRRELWLPKWMARHELGEKLTEKGIPAIIRRVRWFERLARPRLARLLDTRVATSVLGVVLLVFVAGAFVAPPFTGLDTLPSLGVVVVALGILFSDALLVGAGIVAGIAGLVLEVVLGLAAWSLL